MPVKTIVERYCIEIFNLLNSIGEKSWSKEFETLINEFESSERTSLYRTIAKIYTGFGSFNDLVLYKDGKMCIEENEKLDELRKGLYEEVKKAF